MSTVSRVLAGSLVAAAMIVILVALALLAVGNPIWFRLAQERAQADAWTGWPMATVTDVTNAVYADLIVGPPDFAQVVDDRPVFSERERSHFRDVRVALLGFTVGSIVALAWLLGAHRLARGRPWFWLGVAGGAIALAAGVALLGTVSLFAFEQVFEVFHALLFPAGSYNFDPAAERMVQLFPMQLWFETSIALGVVLVALAIVTLAVAVAQLRRRPLPASSTPSPGDAMPVVGRDGASRDVRTP